MSVEGPVDCAICGLSLGAGIPGAMKYCEGCAKWVITEARQESSNAIGALLVGVGIVAVCAFIGWLLGGN